MDWRDQVILWARGGRLQACSHSGAHQALERLEKLLYSAARNAGARVRDVFRVEAPEGNIDFYVIDEEDYALALRARVVEKAGWKCVVLGELPTA